MPISHGLIDNQGNILGGSGDFTASKDQNGFYLDFDRNVETASVVATHDRSFCDLLGAEPIEVGRSDDQPSRVCIFSVNGRFSFILIDQDPGEAGEQDETSADNQLRQSHEGRVYDLDFIANSDWVQVLLEPLSGSTIVGVTQDPRAVSILAAAMGQNDTVTLDTKGKDPAHITRVKWNRG